MQYMDFFEMMYSILSRKPMHNDNIERMKGNVMFFSFE